MNKRILLISILSAIAGMTFFAFICLAILVKKNYLFDIDTQAIDLVNKIRNGGLSIFVKIFTYLGSVVVLIPVAVVMFFLFKGKREKIFIVSTFALAGILATVMKYLVCRGRPEGVAIIEEVGYSFPSAHTMLSLVVYGILIYLLLKFVNKKSIKVIATILLSLVIIALALSRVYLGVHFMTDVLAGWLLGACVLVLCIVCYEFAFNKQSLSK